MYLYAMQQSLDCMVFGSASSSFGYPSYPQFPSLVYLLPVSLPQCFPLLSNVPLLLHLSMAGPVAMDTMTLIEKIQGIPLHITGYSLRLPCTFPCCPTFSRRDAQLSSPVHGQLLPFCIRAVCRHRASSPRRRRLLHKDVHPRQYKGRAAPLSRERVAPVMPSCNCSYSSDSRL